MWEACLDFHVSFQVLRSLVEWVAVVLHHQASVYSHHHHSSPTRRHMVQDCQDRHLQGCLLVHHLLDLIQQMVAHLRDNLYQVQITPYHIYTVLTTAFFLFTMWCNSTTYLLDTDTVIAIISWLCMHAYQIKSKGKEAGFVWRPIVRRSPLKRSGMDHTVFTLQLHRTCLYLVKHSPDGATTDSGNSRLIAAYYSFIDSERMKGWVGLVGWPTADGLPT